MAITKASSSAVAPAAKGDLVVGNATNDSGVLAVGANGTVLTAASGQATGLEWATPSSGGMTLLSTTTLSGATTTISSIDQTYKNLQIVMSGVTASAANAPQFRANGSTSLFTGSTAVSTTNTNNTLFRDYLPLQTGVDWNNANSNNIVTIDIYNYASASAMKTIIYSGGYINTTNARAFSGGGYLETTSAITSVVFSWGSGTFSGGTVLIYGVK